MSTTILRSTEKNTFTNSHRQKCLCVDKLKCVSNGVWYPGDVILLPLYSTFHRFHNKLTDLTSELLKKSWEGKGLGRGNILQLKYKCV